MLLLPIVIPCFCNYFYYEKKIFCCVCQVVRVDVATWKIGKLGEPNVARTNVMLILTTNVAGALLLCYSEKETENRKRESTR